MTTTLHDHAKHAVEANDYKTAAVLELLGMNPLLASLHLLDVRGGAFVYSDRVNQEGLQQDKMERLRIAGGDFDVLFDRVSHRSAEEAGKLKTFGDYLARLFVCGDSRRDAREPIGLYHRVPYHKRYTTGFDDLDAVVSEVRDANAIITTEAVAKTMPRLTYRFDRYGRRHAFYGEVIVIALPPAVLPSHGPGWSISEPDVPGDWLVVVRFGDDGVVGLQNNAPEVDDLGLVKVNPDADLPTLYRTRLEWLLAPGVFAADALARLELNP